ncbi:MAG: hypothetical protein DRR19_12955 [Candidatus Parabeggiatoa sp. nov. 1]|nr:MAG: hypothetical protein DRR19_12955 [Gammaproteobacteria bacterium]
MQMRFWKPWMIVRSTFVSKIERKLFAQSQKVNTFKGKVNRWAIPRKSLVITDLGGGDCLSLYGFLGLQKCWGQPYSRQKFF